MEFLARLPEAFRRMGAPWLMKTAVAPAAPASQCTNVRAIQCQVAMTARSPAHALKLRTLHTHDSDAEATNQSVRVLISGRMADVCAELDRLVALEAQPTLH